jgi:hypothetical protein
LRGIRTLEEGNQFLEEYLPLYNRRFSVCPKEKENFHRPLAKGLDLDTIKTSKVLVQDRIDGSMIMTYKGRSLRFKEISARPVRENRVPVGVRKKKPYTPPSNHPWRRFTLSKHRYERGNLLESQPWKEDISILA